MRDKIMDRKYISQIGKRKIKQYSFQNFNSFHANKTQSPISTHDLWFTSPIH